MIKRLQISSLSICFSLLISIRLITAFFLPLIDRTESRYAEIARKMVETGDWITLFHDYGIPFWGKPPLSTWLSAVGMSILGINAFAARFPIFLVSLFIIGLVVNIAQTRQQEALPKLSALILFSGVLFYIASAAVMTDMPLTLGTTLCMVSFWRGLKSEGPSFWKYLFFVGLAIGLLAKGPIALVVTAIPIAVWGLSQRPLKQLWQKFPWILGTILMLGISAPWYIMAELKTPGFLDYFFIEEHLNRFLVKNWSGDLYGFAHDEPLGFIWVYWLIGAAPWSLWAVGIMIFHIREWRTLLISEEGWKFYLLLWTISPLLFFTFSHNLIWTYCLPGLPAFSLLMGDFFIKGIKKSLTIRRTFFASTLVSPSIMLGVVIFNHFFPYTLNHPKELVESFMRTHPNKNAKLLYYGSTSYSATFYSNGAVPLIPTVPLLLEALKGKGEIYVAVKKRRYKKFPQYLKDALHEEKTINKMILFKKK